MDARQNLRRCEICQKDIHRASFAKHLRSKLHEENQKIIPSNFFKEQSNFKNCETKTSTNTKTISKK